MKEVKGHANFFLQKLDFIWFPFQVLIRNFVNKVDVKKMKLTEQCWNFVKKVEGNNVANG